MEKSRSVDGLFLGALTGGAFGILAGIMFAPKAGRELRTDIKGKGLRLYGDAKEKVSDTQAKAKSFIQGAKHRAEELKIEAEHRLSEAHLKACMALNCGGKAPLHDEERTGARA
jgi:gas vesicle protein